MPAAISDVRCFLCSVPVLLTPEAAAPRFRHLQKVSFMMRELAEKAKAWPFVEARRVLKRVGGKNTG